VHSEVLADNNSQNSIILDCTNTHTKMSNPVIPKANPGVLKEEW